MFAVDLNRPAHRARGNSEDLIDVKGVAISSVLSLHCLAIKTVALKGTDKKKALQLESRGRDSFTLPWAWMDVASEKNNIY